MTLRRPAHIHLAVMILAAIPASISAADIRENGRNPAGPAAACTSVLQDGTNLMNPSVFRPVTNWDRLTISQPHHEIIPLDVVLADLKPDECGALVGVRLMQHRNLQVYRLRILKDTGGVIDLYVDARTGIPL